MAPSLKFSLISWMFILAIGVANTRGNHQHAESSVKHIKVKLYTQKAYHV